MENVCVSQTRQHFYHIGCCNWFDAINLREFLLNNEVKDKCSVLFRGIVHGQVKPVTLTRNMRSEHFRVWSH